jgi:phosphoribosylformylglycinamidine cyclo-ligase
VPNEKLKGLAHITGGGLIDNLPRVLPDNCDAVIALGSWKVPPIFRILEERGRVRETETYQVFNMGIGMVAIVSPENAATVGKQLRAKSIGRIDRGRGLVRLV